MKRILLFYFVLAPTVVHCMQPQAIPATQPPPVLLAPSPALQQAILNTVTAASRAAKLAKAGFTMTMAIWAGCTVTGILGAVLSRHYLATSQVNAGKLIIGSGIIGFLLGNIVAVLRYRYPLQAARTAAKNAAHELRNQLQQYVGRNPIPDDTKKKVTKLCVLSGLQQANIKQDVKNEFYSAWKQSKK